MKIKRNVPRCCDTCVYFHTEPDKEPCAVCRHNGGHRYWKSAVQEWVPYEERRPRRSDFYIVQTTQRQIYLAYFNDGKYWHRRDGMTLYGDVVAWMPLPEPYRESDDV